MGSGKLPGRRPFRFVKKTRRRENACWTRICNNPILFCKNAGPAWRDSVLPTLTLLAARSHEGNGFVFSAGLIHPSLPESAGVAWRQLFCKTWRWAAASPQPKAILFCKKTGERRNACSTHTCRNLILFCKNVGSACRDSFCQRPTPLTAGAYEGNGFVFSDGLIHRCLPECAAVA